MEKIIFGLVVSTILIGCISQSDYDKLLTENEKLKGEIEKCIHGVCCIKEDIAVMHNEVLNERQPEYIKNKSLKLLLNSIEKQEIAQKTRKKAGVKEKGHTGDSCRIGIWDVKHFVDDLGTPTEQRYICNSSMITGTFSNTETKNAALQVKLLIFDYNDISIKLYKHASDIPLQAYSPDSYSVWIQNKDKEQLELIATNFSDRLSFDKYSSKKIHNVLLKGGDVQFKIVGIDSPINQYEFKLQDTDCYKHTYKALQEM